MGAATLFRIAWRNLWRNSRRTALALAAIGLSVTLVLVYDGVLRWESDWMLETITGPMLGHVQVHAPEWRQTRSMDRTLRGATAILDNVRRDPDVLAANPRIYAPALAALGQEGFAVVVLGVDTRAETRAGRLLAGAGDPPAGRQVLMGRLLAEQMSVRPGAEIALVGQAVDGSLANDLFVVAALVETPVDMVNRQGVVMALESAQALFAMNDEIHEVVIYARDPDRAQGIAARLDGAPAAGGGEARDWRTLAPGMVELLRLVEVSWMFVLVLVLAAAAAGVANTMLMATFERTHEFGMLLALGMTPPGIIAMILLESIVLALAGALAGAAAGSGLVAWAHHTGVDYAVLTGGGPSELSFAGMNWSLRLYPRLVAADVATVIAAVTATSILASAWPAARAARLQPVRALRD